MSLLSEFRKSLLIVGVIAICSCPAYGAPTDSEDSKPEEAELYFNNKGVPETMEDLMAMEKALKAGREKVKAAVVALNVGGGSGSGVIVSEDGLILTAAHVTAGVGVEIEVVMPDGSKKTATSLGLRADFDAAMAQLTDEGPYPFVEVEKEIPAIGEWVFSIGHSGGFDGDRGMVTRIGRIVRKQPHTIQSDCTLIGGDSGGPLFNMKGELVGIHSRVSKSLEQNMHVTIPIFEEEWDKMLDSQFVGEGPFAQKVEGFLGVAVEETSEGLKVSDVAEGGAADDAGIVVGDFIEKFNAVELTDRDSLAKAIQNSGLKAKIQLRRDGEPLEIDVTLKPKFSDS